MTDQPFNALEWAQAQLQRPTELADREPVRDIPVSAAPEREIPDVRQGTFCDVFRGPYAGRYGVYSDTATRYPDGTPNTVIIQTRDADDLRIVVFYSDIKPAEPGRR